MKRHLIVLLVALALVGGACASKAPTTLPPVSAASGVVYVAVGASESVGVGADDPIREAWTQVLYRGALPTDATFTNVAVSGSTAAEALRNQVPAALDAKPTLVTIWLNVNDLVAFVSPATYEKTLQQIVHAMRRDAQTTVLVANTPPVEDLPALQRVARGFLSGPQARQMIAARVDEYNAAIARVVLAEGAVLVDLHAAGVAARAAGTEASLISSEDGFHPSTAGHAAIAATFKAALPASALKA